MGNPLILLAGEMFMHNLESEIEKLPLFSQVIFWNKCIDDIFTCFLDTTVREKSMYTLSSWGSQLGIVAVDLSHQEYPGLMLDQRAINNSAKFVSPCFQAVAALNPPCIPLISGRNLAGIRPIIFHAGEPFDDAKFQKMEKLFKWTPHKMNGKVLSFKSSETLGFGSSKWV